MPILETAAKGTHRAILIIIGLGYFIAAVVIAWATFWGGALAVGAGNSTEVAGGIIYLLIVIALLFGGVGLAKNFVAGKPAWWKIPASLLPAVLSFTIILARFAEWTAVE